MISLELYITDIIDLKRHCVVFVTIPLREKNISPRNFDPWLSLLKQEAVYVPWYCVKHELDQCVK
jgi:hypothetical protein